MLVDVIVVARCGFANACPGVSFRCHRPAECERRYNGCQGV